MERKSCWAWGSIFSQTSLCPQGAPLYTCVRVSSGTLSAIYCFSHRMCEGNTCLSELSGGLKATSHVVCLAQYCAHFMRPLSAQSPGRETFLQIHCFQESVPESNSAHHGGTGLSKGLHESSKGRRTSECSEFPLLILVQRERPVSHVDFGQGVQGPGCWNQFCYHPSVYLWASLLPLFNSFHLILQVMVSPPQPASVSSTTCQELCQGTGYGALPSRSTGSGRSGKTQTQINFTQDECCDGSSVLWEQRRSGE